MHIPLHDIPRFSIFFLEELFLIFNQMLSFRAFGRRDTGISEKRNGSYGGYTEGPLRLSRYF